MLSKCAWPYQARDLRALLQTAGESQEGSKLLAALYPSWCISPGAVLALCFLSQVSPATLFDCMLQCCGGSVKMDK
jgi:hypothetical protein